MDTFTGIANAVTHSALSTGEYGEGVLHVTTFRLDGVHQISVKASRRFEIGDGDLIAVAGTPRGYVLNALAYENLSTHEKGNVGKWESLFGGVAFLAFSLWLASAHVAVLGAIGGAWCLVRAARISLAEHDLRHEVSRYKGGPGSSNGVPLSDA